MHEEQGGTGDGTWSVRLTRKVKCTVRVAEVRGGRSFYPSTGLGVLRDAARLLEDAIPRHRSARSFFISFWIAQTIQGVVCEAKGPSRSGGG